MNDVLIIAEAGVNHNGKRELAFQLVDAALAAGADAVKFQTFKTEKLVTRGAAKADYQLGTTNPNESQFTLLKQLELSHQTHRELSAYCNEKGIAFLSTAFDHDSLIFLVNDLGLKTLKIPSGEITNGPLLLAHAQTNCDLIVSTGMATLGEIEDALGVIAFGLMTQNRATNAPARGAFRQAYLSRKGRQKLMEKVTLLHCTTEYPAPLEDINLRAIQTMEQTFGLQTGYSDHSEGITVPIAAVTMGASIIEKHFTLDRTMPGPDHAASLEPNELKKMVSAVRAVGQAMGDGLKGPMRSELSNRDIARKSLVAANDIRKGDIFAADNLDIKRPGTGRSPMDYWDMLGEESHRDFRQDEIIS